LGVSSISETPTAIGTGARAIQSSTNEIFLGFTNIFEYFNEVDFLMDDVIGGCRSDKES